MSFAERTLSIIKPDATKSNKIGEIVAMIEAKGLKVVAMKKIKLTKERVKQFYKEHEKRPFYNKLCTFMSDGSVVVMVLEGDDAIKGYRELMGATDPQEAEEGTIRKKFGTDKTKTAVHGSDSPESAEREINFFFEEKEIVG
jgi:nucleoside-diphosphate kinase